MSTEMDALRMDERQRIAWLRANRMTLIAVGLVWIALIAWDLMHRRLPLFQIIMVPAFAGLRLALYRHFARVTNNES